MRCVASLTDTAHCIGCFFRARPPVCLPLCECRWQAVKRLQAISEGDHEVVEGVCIKDYRYLTRVELSSLLRLLLHPPSSGAPSGREPNNNLCVHCACDPTCGRPTGFDHRFAAQDDTRVCARAARICLHSVR